MICYFLEPSLSFLVYLIFPNIVVFAIYFSSASSFSCFDLPPHATPGLEKFLVCRRYFGTLPLNY